MNCKIVFTAATACLLVACGDNSSAPQSAPPSPSLPAVNTICSQDAMQCPDGSWISRSGPKCEFVCPPAPAK